jgi:hypothetical protein
LCEIPNGKAFKAPRLINAHRAHPSHLPNDPKKTPPKNRKIAKLKVQISIHHKKKTYIIAHPPLHHETNSPFHNSSRQSPSSISLLFALAALTASLHALSSFLSKCPMKSNTAYPVPYTEKQASGSRGERRRKRVTRKVMLRVRARMKTVAMVRISRGVGRVGLDVDVVEVGVELEGATADLEVGDLVVLEVGRSVEVMREVMFVIMLEARGKAFALGLVVLTGDMVVGMWINVMYFIYQCCRPFVSCGSCPRQSKCCAVPYYVVGVNDKSILRIRSNKGRGVLSAFLLVQWSGTQGEQKSAQCKQAG